MRCCLEARSCWLRAGRRWLVEDASLSITPGRFIALIGPNGAGKSSLLRLLSGEYTATRGSVFLNECDLRQWKLIERARRRAVLAQDGAIDALFTALEVVLMGRSPHAARSAAEDHRIALEAMRLTEVTHLRDRLFPSLSGGERQRVQLARVLTQVWEEGSVGNGRYLLLDEPTSALDLSHQHSILRIVRNFTQRSVGALAVLHDMNLAASYADEVAVMCQGRIAVKGTPEEVLQPELIQQVFGLPVLVTRQPNSSRPLVVALP